MCPVNLLPICPVRTDLMTRRDGWPQARGAESDFPDRWLHSDANHIALRFNYPLYVDWITKGNLQ